MSITGRKNEISCGGQWFLSNLSVVLAYGTEKKTAKSYSSFIPPSQSTQSFSETETFWQCKKIFFRCFTGDEAKFFARRIEKKLENKGICWDSDFRPLTCRGTP